MLNIIVVDGSFGEGIAYFGVAVVGTLGGVAAMEMPFGAGRSSASSPSFPFAGFLSCFLCVEPFPLKNSSLTVVALQSVVAQLE
jgi:hypothetical protein